MRRLLFNIASAVSLVLWILYAMLDAYLFLLGPQARFVWDTFPEAHFRIVGRSIATLAVLGILPAL